MIASIAEMAFMAPGMASSIIGFSEFAPKCLQKPLSNLVGWNSALGWVTGVPSAAQLTSTLIQGLVLLRDPEADVVKLWQITLFIMAFMILCSAFNIFFPRALPSTEAAFMVVHVVGFFVFLVMLWVTSPHAPAKDVFTQFNDYGGRGNTGLSAKVGIKHLSAAFSDWTQAPTWLRK